MVTICVRAGDIELLKGSTLKNGLRIAAQGTEGLKAYKDAASVLIKQIDPRLEAMSAEAILAAGEAKTGNTLSGFTANHAIVSPEEQEILNRAANYKAFNEKELFSLTNVLAMLHQDVARATISYQKSPNAKDRLRIAKLNAEMGFVPVALVCHMLEKKPSVVEAAVKGTLTLDTLKSAYPKAFIADKLIQRVDDQRDILLDITDEIRTGRPCTNYLLAQAHRQGALLNDSGRIAPSIVVKSTQALRTNSPVAVSQLHPALQSALEETGVEFRKEAEQLPFLSRNLLLTAWDNGVKRGIKPAENERYHLALQR